MQTCPSCANLLRNPYFCDLCQHSSPSAAPDVVEDARQRDLPAEARLRAMAFWFQLDGALIGAGALLALMSVWFGEGSDSGRGLLMLGLALWGGLWAVIGYHLFRFSERARVAILLIQLASMAGFVLVLVTHDDHGYSTPTPPENIVAMVLAFAAQLAFLFSLFSRRLSRVCSPLYRGMVARTPGLRASFARNGWFACIFAAHCLLLFCAMVTWLPDALRRY